MMKRAKTGKMIASALLAMLMLLQSVSCTKTEAGNETDITENVGTSETVGTVGEELRPSGKIDDDAKKVDGIAISNAKELAKIGNDKKYPLDGDYVLVADIDMSEYGAFTPIGGAASECGIVEGSNVFSGTFDGRGHTIYGLTISVSSAEREHVGLFGTVASKNENAPAVIKNLIIKNASVTGTINAPATCAVLIGQADGYVTIDNVALMSGELDIKTAGSGDSLGFGALIGQCRTSDSTGLNNNGIKITNILSNINVTGENYGRSNYTSGLIGRIRGSDLGELTNVLMLGTVYHEGSKSHSIAAGDSHVISTANVYYRAGYSVDTNYNGKTKSTSTLTDGKIELSGSSWSIEEGRYPLLNIVLDSGMYTPLDFVSVKLASGDNVNKVTENFELTTEMFGKTVEWVSSDTDYIKIDGARAVVTTPEAGSKTVVLTATMDGISNSYTLKVDSNLRGSIGYDGKQTLTAVNYSEGSTYNWLAYKADTGESVKNEISTSGTFTLDDTMLNCVIMLSVSGCDNTYFYYSTLPSVSVECDAGYYDLSKGSYSDAHITIYSTEGYTSTSYNGDTKIKLRGNSTAYQAKRPFRLKLDKKTDLFGMGESKHWVLLANAFDRTNLRNKLAYDLSGELGMVYCESTLVNLIYNGEYCGLYQLSENIRVDSGRVDIFDWEDVAEDVAKAIAKAEELSKDERDALEDKLVSNLSWITSGKFGNYTISDYYDTSEFDISGGYLIENDAYYDEVSKFTTENDMKLMISSPEYLSTNSEMMNELKNYIQDMEDAIYSPNRLNSDGLTYSDYMDVGSFIDFWMVNQVFKNVELLFKSCYMYKDVGEKLVFGPIWDMDWTSGNHVNLGGNSGKYNTWWHSESQDREYWYRALYNDPNFILQLWERWQEIGVNLDNMFAQLDTLSEEIKESAEIDNKRWYYNVSYEDEIKLFRDWMNNRRNWMDKQFETPDTLIESFGYFNESKTVILKGAEIVGDELVLSVKTSNQFTSLEVMLNGVSLGDFTPENGKISIPASELRESGKYNAIEIIGKKSDGSYSVIKSRSGQNGSNAVDADYIFFMN